MPEFGNRDYFPLTNQHAACKKGFNKEEKKTQRSTANGMAQLWCKLKHFAERRTKHVCQFFTLADTPSHAAVRKSVGSLI